MKQQLVVPRAGVVMINYNHIKGRDVGSKTVISVLISNVKL